MTKKDRTRNKILQISKNLFFTKGYKDTLITDIANEVEVDRRTIYRHFESKEVILVTIVKSMYNEFGSYLNNTSFENALSAFEKIEALLDKYSHYFQNNIEILILSSMLDNNLSNETRKLKIYQEFVELSQIPDSIIRTLLQEGIYDKSILPDIDIDITSVTINNALLSLASRVVGHKDILDKEQGLESWKMVYSLGDLILRGIKND
jgi:AcrR family transcriptional regulator